MAAGPPRVYIKDLCCVLRTYYTQQLLFVLRQSHSFNDDNIMVMMMMAKQSFCVVRLVNANVHYSSTSYTCTAALSVDDIHPNCPLLFYPLAIDVDVEPAMRTRIVQTVLPAH